MTSVHFYPVLYVAIDGRLQLEQQAVSFEQRIVDNLTRVSVDWALPEGGFEFDGRPHIGTARTFRVLLFAGRWHSFGAPPDGEVSDEWMRRVLCFEVGRWDMRLVEFGGRYTNDRNAQARGVFECAMIPPASEEPDR